MKIKMMEGKWGEGRGGVGDDDLILVDLGWIFVEGGWVLGDVVNIGCTVLVPGVLELIGLG